MTTQDSILVVLDRSQATTSVIADVLHQPAKVVSSFCEDLAGKHLIEPHNLLDAVEVWRITPTGRERLQSIYNEKQNAVLKKA